MNDFSSERWLPIPGFLGWYEVSDLGRVRSVQRHVPGSDGRRTLLPGRLLQPGLDSSGHPRLPLSLPGSRKNYRVHRLVMLAFVGPCPEGMEVCHGPGGHADNRLSNLRYDTRSENQKDRVRHGVNTNSNKTHCNRGHLLKAPNLKPKARGRVCFACARAFSQRKNLRVAGKPEPDMQVLSDSYYSQLMSAPTYDCAG